MGHHFELVDLDDAESGFIGDSQLHGAGEVLFVGRSHRGLLLLALHAGTQQLHELVREVLEVDKELLLGFDNVELLL